LEVDNAGMEVRILACWSKDKKLIEFIVDGFDMHGYWAEKLYNAKKDSDRWKALRYAAKNGFVFANFYGSYYENTAIDTWNYMNDKEKGEWKYLKRWATHVKRCENEFWKMFRGVREKQREAVNKYKQNGFIETIGWGFRRYGYLRRNHVFNTHIQGPAFLCLLKDIIDINQVKKKEQWRTKVPGQIHDAIFFDCHKKEKENVIGVTNYIMTKKLVKENPWIIVPLETEWEQGENWKEMEEVK
jgi:DNA polymerase I-like protein with 3'-5' exonuclease and polymerase domains